MGATSKTRKLTHAGQPFYDRARYVEISRPCVCALTIRNAFLPPIIPGEFVAPACVLELPQPARADHYRPYERLAPIMEQQGFEQVKLNWVKPGPNGTLVPRGKNRNGHR